jgi:HEAT repeat protein
VDALLAFGPEAVPGLIEALGTSDFAARKKVMEALAQARAPRAARALSNFLLTDDIPNAKASREAAWETIKALGMDAVPYLFPALRNPRTQYWTGMLLRETTGQNFASGRVTDWVDWWKKDHPDWKEQAE